VVNEERMTQGYWLGSVLWASFSIIKLLLHPKKPC